MGTSNEYCDDGDFNNTMAQWHNGTMELFCVKGFLQCQEQRRVAGSHASQAIAS